MTKTLLNQTFIKNGKEIELEVIDTELEIEFRMNGKEIKVDINGDNHYMKYDDERFEDIPANIRLFLAESSVTFADDNDVIASFYFTPAKKEFYGQILRINDKKEFTMTESLLDGDRLQEKHPESNIANFAKKELNELIHFIHSQGYLLRHAFEGDNCDNFQSIVVPVEQFDEDKLKSCIDIFEEYDSKLIKYLEQ